MTALIKKPVALGLFLFLLAAESAWGQALPSPSSAVSAMNLANNYFQAQFPNPGLPVTTSGTVRPSNYWFRAVYFEGLMAFYGINPQPSFITYATTWGTGNSWSLVGGNTDRNANDQCAGQSYIDLYNLNPTPAYIANIQADLNYIVASSAPVTDWYWIDAVQMAMPTWAKMGVLTGDTNYFNEMYELYANTRNAQGTAGLYNPVDSLWWRDATFVNPPYVEPNGKSCYWSRGNGWVYAALARVLDILPPSDPHYAGYLADFQAMSAAILAVQQSDGFWTQSLFDPVDFPGPETSGTALFTYGMAWGVRKGILPAATYESAAVTAWNAMVANALHTNGFLGYVQDTGDQPVTGVTYNSVPTFQDIGVGCFLLAGSEIVQLVDNLTATPSATASRTPTASLTPTGTPSNTPTATVTKTGTSTASATPSRTGTASATPTGTLTATRTPTDSMTPSATASSTSSPSLSPTPTASLTATGTASLTATASSTSLPSNTLTATPSNTPSWTPTASFTATATDSHSPSASPTSTATDSESPTATGTSTPSGTTTPSATPSSTATNSLTVTPDPTETPTFTATPTATDSLTITPDPTDTPSLTATLTATSTPTNSATASSTSSPSPIPTDSMTPSATASSTSSPSPSQTPTASLTATGTASVSPTPTVTPSNSPTLSWTTTPTSTASVSSTATGTPSNTASLTPTVPFTTTGTPTTTSTLTETPVAATPTPTWTATPSATAGPANSPSRTPTAASTPTRTATPGATPVLFPNPATGTTVQINLEFTPTTGVTVKVFTTANRLVLTKVYPLGSGEVITLSLVNNGVSLANGLYYVVVSAGNKQWTLKLVVER